MVDGLINRVSNMVFCRAISVDTEATGLKAPEAEIIIAGEKKSARFSHPVLLNIGGDCGQCHHDSDHQPLTDKNIELRLWTPVSSFGRCASCHNKDFANPKTSDPQESVHFHARCKECHKQGVDGKQGPTKCTGCHIKK